MNVCSRGEISQAGRSIRIERDFQIFHVKVFGRVKQLRSSRMQIELMLKTPK